LALHGRVVKWQTR